MSNLYHAFTPGFNGWYIYVPVTLMFIAFVSSFAPKVAYNEKRGYYSVYRWTRKGDAIFKIIVGILCCVLGWLILQQSGRGLVQFFDNRLLKYESGVWSLFSAAAAVAFVLVVYLGLAFFARHIVTKAKAKKLRPKARQLNQALMEERRNATDDSDGYHYRDIK